MSQFEREILRPYLVVENNFYKYICIYIHIVVKNKNKTWKYVFKRIKSYFQKPCRILLYFHYSFSNTFFISTTNYKLNFCYACYLILLQRSISLRPGMSRLWNSLNFVAIRADISGSRRSAAESVWLINSRVKKKVIYLSYSNLPLNCISKISNTRIRKRNI